METERREEYIRIVCGVIMIKPRRCPKCNKYPESYRELWTRHEIVFVGENCRFDGSPNLLDDDVWTPEHNFIITCSCGHSWMVSRWERK